MFDYRKQIEINEMEYLEMKYGDIELLKKDDICIQLMQLNNTPLDKEINTKDRLYKKQILEFMLRWINNDYEYITQFGDGNYYTIDLTTPEGVYHAIKQEFGNSYVQQLIYDICGDTFSQKGFKIFGKKLTSEYNNYVYHSEINKLYQVIYKTIGLADNCKRKAAINNFKEVK